MTRAPQLRPRPAKRERSDPLGTDEDSPSNTDGDSPSGTDEESSSGADEDKRVRWDPKLPKGRPRKLPWKNMVGASMRERSDHSGTDEDSPPSKRVHLKVSSDASVPGIASDASVPKAFVSKASVSEVMSDASVPEASVPEAKSDASVPEAASDASVPEASAQKPTELTPKQQWLELWSKRTPQYSLWCGQQKLVFARGDGTKTMGSILVGCNGDPETFTALVKHLYENNPHAVQVMLEKGIDYYTQSYDVYF